MSLRVARLAEASVLWDGATEDGECPFCGGPYAEEQPWVLHEPDCPIAVHRLALITRLVADDPAAESPEGKLLVQLVAAQERWEKVKFPLGGALAAPGEGT